MTSVLSAELAASCSALGYFDAKSNKYFADANTLETVKDIIRYLRRDNDFFDVRRQLGKAKVLQTDLLPLLKNYWEEFDLFDVLLRLIINLTVPALMLHNEQMPTEKKRRNRYLQIEDHLQSYKEAFVDEGVWAVISTKLSKLLELDYAERGDENGLIIERILILVRNILYVPADAAEKRPDNDASVHDQVLWALHQSGMLDIILYMTSSSHENAYYMHILEILSCMLREQKASELASAELERSQTEKIRDEAELLAIRHRELDQKHAKARVYTSTRHSRFGGTFVVKSMKSISDNELIYHKPLNKLDALNFDVDKKRKRTPKNRVPLASTTSDRRSAFTIRLFLKEFCVEFLNGAYNMLMGVVKDNLVRAKAQAHDESYYLWALRFFMEFNRCYKFEVKLVSETMTIETFHYVQQQSEKYFDMMSTDKRRLRLWSRRLHLALLAYRELLLTLSAMDRSPDGAVRDSSKAMKGNVFYVPEYREFILALLVTFDEGKFSDVYLRDLMETQHIFLKMFEAFCGENPLLVQLRAGRGRRNKKETGDVQPAGEPADLNLEGRWDEAAPQLSVVLEGASDLAHVDAVPFDAALDVPIDDQKADAMKNVQRRLRSGEFEGAVALLRASREVWPENDSFGSNNMTPEEEFLALRDIFFADLGENEPRKDQTQPEDNNEEDDEYDEEEVDGPPQYYESTFKFEDFTKRLPHPKIVQACGLALRSFDMNSVNTNHCIVKLLHRIAFDCKMYAIVFQVSIFRTFQRIFAVKHLPQHKELVKFATYIMSRFFKVAETNRTVFMEALFWKSTREAFDLEHGYGSYLEMTNPSVWSEQEEDELRRLFMEHKQNNIEEDVVDWIVNNLIDNTRTRRGVMRKLREMCLLVDYKGRKKSGVKTKNPRSWGAEEEMQLRELYEQFKDADDPLGMIIPRLEIVRPKNRIVEKLLVMGLIQDKKEVRKKRSKGAKSRGKTSKSQPGSGDDSSSTSDSDDNAVSPHNAPASFGAGAPNKNSTASRKKPKKNKNKNAPAPVPRSQLVRLLLNNMQSGQEEALEWLKESLSDAIEDFEDASEEGIPLVPIMDYAQTAMDDGEFQRMLKALGVCEPFDEQETYWRIPNDIPVATLKSYCDLIQEALDKTLTLIENENKQSENRAESDDDDNIFDKLRSMTRPPEINSVVESAQNDASDSYEDPFDKIRENIPINEIPAKENNVANDQAVNDDETEELNRENDKSNTSLNKRKSRQIIDSDDEDVTAVESDSKRNRSVSDSDTEKPSAKRSRVIDSDDDE